MQRNWLLSNKRIRTDSGSPLCDSISALRCLVKLRSSTNSVGRPSSLDQAIPSSVVVFLSFVLFCISSMMVENWGTNCDLTTQKQLNQCISHVKQFLRLNLASFSRIVVFLCFCFVSFRFRGRWESGSNLESMFAFIRSPAILRTSMCSSYGLQWIQCLFVSNLSSHGYVCSCLEVVACNLACDLARATVVLSFPFMQRKQRRVIQLFPFVIME